MTARTAPPFRADHVGSFLRPKELLEARDRHFKQGAITRAQLREVEDRAIRDVVRLQEDWGLQDVTDGEFRRTYFHIDFLEQLEGVEVRQGAMGKFHGAKGDVDFAPPVMHVTKRIRHARPIQLEDFKFLKSVAGRTPKVTIPSPTMLHFRGGRGAISKEAYPDLEAFYADVAACYRAELKSLGEAGCSYLQLDDTNLAYLCDPNFRKGAAERGDDPDKLPAMYAGLINESIKDRPEDMTVCVHLCRGNARSMFFASGGYEPVAEAMLGLTKVDGFFLEYDDARSGDFSPLRFTPKGGAQIVLGLVTTKRPELEKKDDLKRRIDEASKYVPAEQLCISPQCGFSSNALGNLLTEDDEKRKLGLVVETAREVWGS